MELLEKGTTNQIQGKLSTYLFICFCIQKMESPDAKAFKRQNQQF
jgi:hypothetical protein